MNIIFKLAKAIEQTPEFEKVTLTKDDASELLAYVIAHCETQAAKEREIKTCPVCENIAMIEIRGDDGLVEYCCCCLSEQ